MCPHPISSRPLSRVSGLQGLPVSSLGRRLSHRRWQLGCQVSRWPSQTQRDSPKSLEQLIQQFLIRQPWGAPFVPTVLIMLAHQVVNMLVGEGLKKRLSRILRGCLGCGVPSGTHTWLVMLDRCGSLQYAPQHQHLIHWDY